MIISHHFCYTIIIFFITTFTISLTESLDTITPTQSLSINQTITISLNQNKNQNPILSSNHTYFQTQIKSPVAQLFDSGNFILKDKDADEFIWQSFDYPTDTLLPGMKLGWDLKTGVDKHITSWKNRDDDPGTGEFSFQLNFHGFPEIFLYDNGRKIYRSGPWNGLRFSGVPEMKPQEEEMEFDFVVNQNQVYYTFDITDTRIFSRLIVYDKGTLQRLTWIPSTNIWNPFWYAPKDQCDN